MHKKSNNYRPQRLRPILLFDIEANIHNNNIVRIATSKAENLKWLSPEKYGRRKSKAADTQAYNTRLFYDSDRKNNLRNDKIHKPCLQLWSGSPQYLLHIPSKNQQPQGTDTMW